MKTIMEEMSHFKVSDEVKTSLRNEYIKSLKDNDFKEFVSKLSLSDETLMKYTSKLQDCYKEYKNCKTCKGLVECKNNVPGYALTPHVNNNKVVFSYDMCEYTRKLKLENKYQANTFYFDVPKEIKNAKMSDVFTNDVNRAPILSWIKDFYKDYKNTKKGKGLYLSGSFGSGKTYLIAALFNELAKNDMKVSIIYWPEFLRVLKASFETDYDEKYEYIKKVPILLIDDIGAENLTPWARDEILGSILQFRMQEGLTTFFTSNLNLEELETHLSITGNKVEKLKAKRIIERIKQLTIEISLISKNNRK